MVKLRRINRKMVKVRVKNRPPLRLPVLQILRMTNEKLKLATDVKVVVALLLTLNNRPIFDSKSFN